MTSRLLRRSFSIQHFPDKRANSLRIASNASGISRISFFDIILVTATGKGHHDGSNLNRCV